MTSSTFIRRSSCAGRRDPSRCWVAAAIIGKARAAAMKIAHLLLAAERSEIRHGRVLLFYNLMSTSRRWAPPSQVEPAFFPRYQLGQEIDVINRSSLASSNDDLRARRSPNLVPIVFAFDLGYLFVQFPQQTKRSRPAPPSRRGGAAEGGNTASSPWAIMSARAAFWPKCGEGLRTAAA